METSDFQPALSAAALFNTFPRPWCVAGGWALDLFLGRLTRQHDEVQLAVLREHLMDLPQHLPKWTWKLSINRTLRPWDGRQYLMLPIHELHATGAKKESVEVLLQEGDGIDWQYRRNFSVRLNLSKWIVPGPMGVPLLNPAIVLLYKSKTPGPKDELDFRSAIHSGRLSTVDLDWLGSALFRLNPTHPWLAQM